jgi:sugar/nucleoside kinase (ribokinase family)
VARLLVIGDVVDEVIVRPLGAPSPLSDTPSAIADCPGGSAANQAAWLGYLGVEVRFAGRVGVPDVGRHAGELSRYGVDARLVPDPEAGTGRIVVIVGKRGERSMFTDRGANLRLSAEDLGHDLLEEVDIFQVSGYSLFHPPVREVVRELMVEAQRRDITVSVDPASEAGLREVGPERFLAWVARAKLIFPNLDEGRVLTGCQDPQDVAENLARHFDLVGLKVGEEGAVVATRDGGMWWLPPPPAKVVDTTGAGDAFCAGFLARWVAGWSPPECARGALEAASEAVEHLGARPSPGQPR